MPALGNWWQLLGLILIFGWNKRGFFSSKFRWFLKTSVWLDESRRLCNAHTHTPCHPGPYHSHTHACSLATHAHTHLWHQPFKDPPRHAEQGSDSSKQHGVREKFRSACENVCTRMRAQSGNFSPLGMWGRVALAVSRSILQSSLQPNVSPRASTPNSVVSSFFDVFRRWEDWRHFFQKVVRFLIK